MLVVVSGRVGQPVLLESAVGPTPHAPEEVQDVAFIEDQVSIEELPLATDVGFAASDTVGAGGGVEPGELTNVTGSPAPPQAAVAKANRGASSNVFSRNMAVPIP